MVNEAKTLPAYMTIRKFAEFRNLSYWHISKLVKEKKIPARYEGRKVHINVEQAKKIMDEEDRRSVQPKANLPIYSGKSRGVLTPKRQASN